MKTRMFKYGKLYNDVYGVSYKKWVVAFARVERDHYCMTYIVEMLNAACRGQKAFKKAYQQFVDAFDNLVICDGNAELARRLNKAKNRRTT